MLPRILIIDDLFGRTHTRGRNSERANLCGKFLIDDITGDEQTPPGRILKPMAQAVFFRGQRPSRATVGDSVENDLEATLATVRRGWTSRALGEPCWAMVLLDLCFYTGTVTQESDRKTPGVPEGRPDDDSPEQYFGLKLLHAIKNEFPELPILILSSKPKEGVSREYTRLGALGFLPRADEDSSRLLREHLLESGLVPDETGTIAGTSISLMLALRAARQASGKRANILIRGERGTGKELLARYIHGQRGGTSARPLVEVDSGTLTPSLYASELFGHHRGAFTGADRTQMGKILTANGGDLFLDEIGNMPMEVQGGLLRVLDQKTVIPIGETTGQRVDVRFLSATNADLDDRAQRGLFKDDLLDRLRRGGTLTLAPLRDRPEDLFPLVERFLRKAEGATEGALTRTIEVEAMKDLLARTWPGNIRELETCISEAVARYPKAEHLFPVHLPQTGISKETTHRTIAPPARTGTLTNGPMVEAERPSTSPLTLEQLLEFVETFKFDSTSVVGKLGSVEAACAVLAARVLKTAIEATLRRTPDAPEGQVQIHPAIKLLTGDRDITASQAADIVKRLLNLSSKSTELRSTEPLLQEAYDIAVRLRPTRPRR
jgi:DNA-binding NtrC family response regulator